MKKFILLLIVSASCIQVKAQTDKEFFIKLLDKSAQYYDLKEYTLRMRYDLFDNHKDEKPAESYISEMVKLGDNHYVKMNHITWLKVKNVVLAVDEEQRAIIIGNMAKPPTGEDPLQFKSYLKFFKTIKRVQKGQFERYILTTPSITQLPYHKMVIDIKRSGEIVRKEVFLVNQVNYMKDGEMVTVQPRIVTSYQSLVKKADPSKFTFKNYVTKVDGKYLPTKKYREYRVIGAN